MIRIFLVDDQRMIRQALSSMLEEADDIEIVGQAETGEEALDQAKALNPHVILMDLDMPGMGGIEATRRFSQRFPDMNIVVVSGQTQEPYPTQALGAGAMGFLTKNSDSIELLRAIRRVRLGKKHIAPEVAGDMATSLVQKDSRSPFDQLSERELTVTLKITAGWRTQQIADMLEITTNTVSSFRRRIYDKIEVSNDVELTLAAFRHGLIGDVLDT